MDYQSILENLSPKELLEYLLSEFYIQLPGEITSIDDMKEASRLGLKLSSGYASLCALASYAKIKCRQTKRDGSKEEYKDMVDKKEVVSNITEAVKQQYAAISRAITVYTKINNELRMTGGV